MKRAIIKVLHDMESQLSGQSAVAAYGYMKLCVKAEEMALLPVKVKKIYEQCKTQMAVACQSAKTKIEVLVKNETDDVKNEVTASFDALKKKWADHRNKVYEEKIKKINKGHDKWQVEEGQKK